MIGCQLLRFSGGEGFLVAGISCQRLIILLHLRVVTRIDVWTTVNGIGAVWRTWPWLGVLVDVDGVGCNLIGLSVSLILW